MEKSSEMINNINFCETCTYGLKYTKEINSIREVDSYIIKNYGNNFRYGNNKNCCFCFSIFSEENIKLVMNSIKSKVNYINDYRITTSFTPLYSLLINYVKENVKNSELKNETDNSELKLNENFSSECKFNYEFDISILRKIFKPVITEKIKEETGKLCILNSNSQINIIFDFNEDFYGRIYKLFENVHSIKKLGLKHFRFNGNASGSGIDKSHINEIFKNTNNSLLKAIFESENLLNLANSCLESKVDIVIDSIFLKGSYIKYCREIGQSPWTINGAKVCASSVQEEMLHLNKIFNSDSIIMHAGGREDRDVRMLGTGRPIMLEIVNPKNFEIKKRLGDPEFVKEFVQKELNKTTDKIEISGLELCEKSYMDLIKKFENSKIKSYTCVVWVSKEISDDDIKMLNEYPETNIIQKTPIRVAHRRSMMDRNKVIYGLKAKKLNEHFMLLDVRSSAGTYIKEFVHSDLGRTTPSLVSIMNCDCDILQLDVTEIILA